MSEEKELPVQLTISIPAVLVESSNVISFGYSEEYAVLEVVFKGGARYRYFGVPKVVFLHLLDAPSKGKLFNETVKRGGYEYQRMV